MNVKEKNVAFSKSKKEKAKKTKKRKRIKMFWLNSRVLSFVHFKCKIFIIITKKKKRNNSAPSIFPLTLIGREGKREERMARG